MRNKIGMHYRGREHSMNGEQGLYRMATPPRMIVASGSEKGRVRTNNEDSITICSPPTQTLFTSLGQLFLLADGAGGHAAGEVASQVAVETISKVYYHPPTFLQDAMYPALEQRKITRYYGPLEGETEVLTHLHHAFLAAHWRIRELAQQQLAYEGMITTCLAAVVKGSQLFIAHVGDSRAYLLQPSSPSASQPMITRLTADHSMVAELERRGVMSSEAVSRSTYRHMLTRALGEHQEPLPVPDLVTYAVQPEMVLLLCCDGLWGVISEEQIARVVCTSPPHQACTALIRMANEAGGPDNISVIIMAFQQ